VVGVLGADLPEALDGPRERIEMNAEVLTGAIQIAALLIATMLGLQLWYTARQSRWTTFNIQISIARALWSDFETPRMLRRRAAVSAFMLKSRSLPVSSETEPQWEVVSDLLDYFQGLAYYVRLGIITPKQAYYDWGYWFCHYYYACVPYIKYWQTRAPLTFSDASWLYEKVQKEDRSKDGNNGHWTGPDLDFDAFFEYEIRNCKRNGATD
jgi:hypothetical protein